MCLNLECQTCPLPMLKISCCLRSTRHYKWQRRLDCNRLMNTFSIFIPYIESSQPHRDLRFLLNWNLVQVLRSLILLDRKALNAWCLLRRLPFYVLLRIFQHHYNRITAQEELRDIPVLVNWLCTFSLASSGHLRPHLSHIFKNHIHVPIEGS